MKKKYGEHWSASHRTECRIENQHIPLDSYWFCNPPDDYGSGVLLGARAGAEGLDLIESLEVALQASVRAPGHTARAAREKR